MTTVALLTKIYNFHQLRQIEEILSDLLGDLSVDAKIIGTLAEKWIQLELTGEDEKVATKLLEREVHFCPVSLANVKKFSALKGYVANVEKSSMALSVDVGVFQPKIVPAVISLRRLQNNIENGAKVSLKKISELWAICENLPLDIKVLELNAEEGRIDAEMHPTQIRRFMQWKDSLLDRLIIIGASLREVNDAMAQAGLNRDVIDVETLGLFEHALVCKLGTDAAGLISRIGRRLRKAKFFVFNPKRVITSLGTVQNVN